MYGETHHWHATIVIRYTTTVTGSVPDSVQTFKSRSSCRILWIVAKMAFKFKLTAFLQMKWHTIYLSNTRCHYFQGRGRTLHSWLIVNTAELYLGLTCGRCTQAFASKPAP